SFNMFFLLSSWTLLRFRATPSWVAVVGLAVACAGFAGMFRNVTAVVVPIAAINNYLLPLWMIVFGVVLLRHRLPDSQVAGAFGADRKSTRLNSSHVSISYAVFCLKKKKKTPRYRIKLINISYNIL